MLDQINGNTAVKENQTRAIQTELDDVIGRLSQVEQNLYAAVTRLGGNRPNAGGDVTSVVEVDGFIAETSVKLASIRGLLASLEESTARLQEAV